MFKLGLYAGKSRRQSPMDSARNAGGDGRHDLLEQDHVKVRGQFHRAIVFVHAHLVVLDDGVVLVDTGLPAAWQTSSGRCTRPDAPSVTYGRSC
jgi:hypothetical protein